MAIALVAHTIAQSVNTTSVTTSAIDTTGANLLVVVLADDNSLGLQTLSDSKGNSWTGLTTQSATNARNRIYYSTPSSVGAGHTFSYGSAVTYPTIAVMAFSGAHASSPFDVQNGATQAGATTAQTGSVTPSQDNCLVISGLALTNARTNSINSSFTISDQAAFNGTTAYGNAAAYLIQTTATATNPTWSWDGTSIQSATTIAVFKPAASGGITYVDTKNGENITGSSVASVATSATMNVVAGNTLVACVMHQSGASITGITDGGSNSFTSSGSTGTNASAGRSVDIWYKLNASANATATFTASFSPNSAYPTIIVLQFSGIATSSALDQIANGFADVNTTVTSSSFTPTQAAEVAIAVAGENTADTSWTPNSGYTGVTASAGTFVQYKITLATSSQTVTAVNGNGQYKAIAVATFKEAAGGGGGPTLRLFTLLGVG